MIPEDWKIIESTEDVRWSAYAKTAYLNVLHAAEKREGERERERVSE